MKPEIVHIAVREPHGVAPLCGAWGDSTNWTLDPAAASCPACLALAARKGSGEEAEESAAPDRPKSGKPPR